MVLYRKRIRGDLMSIQKNQKSKKKNTPLLIGAKIANWTSFVLMILSLIMVVLKLFNLIPLSWGIVWAPFVSGVILGIVWAIFAMIMINVFHKR